MEKLYTFEWKPPSRIGCMDGVRTPQVEVHTHTHTLTLTLILQLISSSTACLPTHVCTLLLLF